MSVLAGVRIRRSCAGALDRRPRLGGDRLERLEVSARRPGVLGAPEHGQEAELPRSISIGTAIAERSGSPGSCRLRVVVRERDGADAAAVRRAGDLRRRLRRRRPLSWRPAARRPSTSDADDARRGAREGGGRLGDAGEYLVEIERLAERPRPMRARTAVLAQALDRRGRELAGEIVHPLAHLAAAPSLDAALRMLHACARTITAQRARATATAVERGHECERRGRSSVSVLAPTLLG